MKPLIDYLAASRTELTKVTWPNRRQTIRLTVLVVCFSLLMAALLGTLDYIFLSIIQKIIVS